MSRIDSWHRKISTSRHFQNGHHNTAQIQHCPISTPFHMWVDYDVPNWFLTSKNFYQSPFSKWPHNTAKIKHCSISKVAFNLFFKPVVSGLLDYNHILFYSILENNELISLSILGIVYFNGGKSCQKYIKIAQENLFHGYSVSEKFIQTGIVQIPGARYSHPLSRLSIHCSKIVNTNHLIKIHVNIFIY
jgi:hypothetical protein